MRTFFKNIIVTVVLVLSLFSFETKGQIGSVYPVDLNVMLTPPYGTCLTDLSNSNRFVIQALLRDMNHGNNYEMLIQMRVKSLSSMNTVFLSYSNKFSIGMGKPAVVLGAGNTPVSISNFFESGNVLIGQNILNDNCLPEGAYLFCFQAFDAKAYYAKQRIPISKEFTVTAFLENGATPILISPANNDSLSCQMPNVIFQWQQPYVTSGINSYTLQVAEANSPFDGPQIIENGGNLLIEKRGLMMPICDIPVTEANFKENHTYYWRVVMCDKDGKARASYPNKGASPVYKFVYCGTPQEPEPEDVWVPQIPMAKSIKKSLDRLRIDTVLSDESSCSAFWFQDPMDVREKYDGVVIEVKKKNQDTWTPFLMESKVATDTLVALSSLAYKETYMARGQYFLYEDGEKVYAPYSDTIEFKIPHPADTLECGNAAPELTDCTNAGERAELEIGDEFNANGTTVSIDTITYQSVNGSSVIISGEGHLPFPILSNFGLKVSFDNIEINCADELKKGQVISVYDEKTAAMIDLNNILGKGAAGNDLKQEDASLTEVGPDDDLSGFKSGDLIVEDGKVSLIVGNGNVVQVGTVIDLSNSDAYNDNGALNDEDIYVKFSNPDHENIAFDDDPTGMIRKAATLSRKYVSFGKEYIIPWVATNPGRIFQLTATPSKDLSKSGFTDVKFVLPASGTHVVLDAVENGDGSYSVSIPGMKVDVQNQVYAIARKGEGSPYENVGKLNLCCYSYKSKKMVIVPLLEGLSVNTDEVKKDLDRVYSKLGYTFEVELDDDAAHREGLSTTIGLETDFLSDFSDELKELIFNYEINIGDAYDKDAAYLFLLDKPTGKHKAAAGIMPQRQQYGFIFMREVTSVTPSITHTMAHELGHGIFGLDHIFSGVYGIEEGATYNLMDYTKKTPNDALSYHEWTQINRPLPNWSALSKAEEDMSEMPNLDYLLISNYVCDQYRDSRFFQNELKAWAENNSSRYEDYIDYNNMYNLTDDNKNMKISYVTPGGQIIELPSTYLPSFTGRSMFGNVDETLTKGVLIGFTTDNSSISGDIFDNEEYVAKYRYDNKTRKTYFTGYYNNKGKRYEPYGGMTGGPVIVGIEHTDCFCVLHKIYLNNRDPYMHGYSFEKPIITEKFNLPIYKEDGEIVGKKYTDYSQSIGDIVLDTLMLSYGCNKAKIPAFLGYEYGSWGKYNNPESNNCFIYKDMAIPSLKIVRKLRVRKGVDIDIYQLSSGAYFIADNRGTESFGNGVLTRQFYWSDTFSDDEKDWVRLDMEFLRNREITCLSCDLREIGLRGVQLAPQFAEETVVLAATFLSICAAFSDGGTTLPFVVTLANKSKLINSSLNFLSGLAKVNSCVAGGIQVAKYSFRLTDFEEGKKFINDWENGGVVQKTVKAVMLCNDAGVETIESVECIVSIVEGVATLNFIDIKKARKDGIDKDEINTIKVASDVLSIITLITNS